ncbi:exo-alpha-sialidase [Actinoplanes sp. NPDC024001]|uniref:exo-alpha-sialidase n=1 Tax=Actinoplanes sp. NPDC024001 TaxID=3154598 RepID=UPI0033ED5546
MNRRKMRKIARVLHRGAAVAATAVLAVTLAPQPAQAAIDIIGTITKEEGGYEPRFPSFVELQDTNDRIMAVWHRALEHAGTVGRIELSIFDEVAGTWSAPVPALSKQTPWADIDTRDPHLTRMRDGKVIMTFFAQGKVYYSYWQPGWTRFADPVELRVAGMPASVASHGGVLPLTNTASNVDEVLVPFYADGSGGGAYYMRAKYQPGTGALLSPQSFRRIIANDDSPATENLRYTEPVLVQVGDTVIAGIRAEAILASPPAGQTGRHARPFVLARWNAYSDTAAFNIHRPLINGSGFLASSHHLLKVGDPSNPDIFITYGNRYDYSHRPTRGVLFKEPLAATWTATVTKQLYDSGHYDQANPSSIERERDWYWTLGFNVNANSADYAKLQIVRSQRADF